MVYGLPQAFGLRNDEGVKGNDFFLFSIFVLTFCGLWIASSFHSSQWQRNKRQYPSHCHCDYETVIARLCRRSENLVIETTTRNPHRHCENRRFVAISVWDTIIYSWNSFYFYFCINFCGLWIASSFYSSQWQHPNIVIARLWKSRGNLVYSRLVIARTEGLWQYINL